VDVVLGASEKFKLLNYINLSGKNTHTEIHNCEISDVNTFVDSFSAGDRTRSFLKVQDGCDYSCTFCTIPLARGKSRSDTIENAVANAKKIAASGVKEIVLTGVNLGDFGYGIDIDKDTKKRKEYNFLDLITELDKVEDIERIRISSIEPNLLTNEVIEFVANSKRFMPHFHIPLQSGNNEILGKMKRRYKRELYQERVTKIKELMPNCCIGVDVIVGFPGETNEHFLDTYNFITSLNVSYLHVFTYSERDNTEAITLEGKVDYAERKRRNKMLRILSAKKMREFYEKHLNQEYSVLFEHENKNGMMFGFTENYIKVGYTFNEKLVNQSVKICTKAINADGIMDSDIVEAITLQ
jgi:threonylcarbamoyladenosine tRNA methylthiotransferase MtaB